MKVTINHVGDHVCEHGTAVDVHCCNCHNGFIFDLDHECPDEEPQRCGGSGMVAYWDGSAYAGEMCRGCVDCEGPDEPEAPAAVDP